jgi:hypothetical protein
VEERVGERRLPILREVYGVGWQEGLFKNDFPAKTSLRHQAK